MGTSSLSSGLQETSLASLFLRSEVLQVLVLGVQHLVVRALGGLGTPIWRRFFWSGGVALFWCEFPAAEAKNGGGFGGRLWRIRETRFARSRLPYVRRVLPSTGLLRFWGAILRSALTLLACFAKLFGIVDLSLFLRGAKESFHCLSCVVLPGVYTRTS